MVGSEFMQVGSTLCKFCKERLVDVELASHYEEIASTNLSFEEITFREPFWYLFGRKLLYRVHFEQVISYKLHFNDSTGTTQIYAVE